MTTEFFISRVWRYISMIAFALVLLFTYRGLPDSTAVHFGMDGKADGFLPRTQLFYLAMSVMVVANMLLLLLSNSVNKLSFVNGFEWALPAWQNNRKAIKDSIVNWINILAAMFNTFLAFILRSILMLNDDRSNQTNYSYLLIIAMVALLLWLIYLPLKLKYSSPSDRYNY